MISGENGIDIGLNLAIEAGGIWRSILAKSIHGEKKTVYPPKNMEAKLIHKLFIRDANLAV
jgi:hypothetical protein